MFEYTLQLSKWIFFFSNWSLVDLQCCASFWNTAKLFIYIYVIYIYYFPLWFMIGSWIWSPVVYNGALFFTHSVYNKLHLLVSKSQSIVPPTSPPLSQPLVCSLCLWVCFCFIEKLIRIIFQIPHISDIWYLSLSLWLTSLSMIISRCIHIAANGMISFLFKAE